MPAPVTADIPVIDLSGPSDTVAKELVDAAAEHGFIYIRNHGREIPAATVDQAFSLVSGVINHEPLR